MIQKRLFIYYNFNVKLQRKKFDGALLRVNAGTGAVAKDSKKETRNLNWCFLVLILVGVKEYLHKKDSVQKKY